MKIALVMTIKKWLPPNPSEIKELRIKSDFTQAKTAHLCRIGLKAYQKWEEGVTSPSQSAWSLYMFELRALKLGFMSLESMLAEAEKKG